MADVTFETFKGNKLVCIPIGEYQGEVQYLKMGYKKAKAVVDHFDDIERFCIVHEEGKEGR